MTFLDKLLRGLIITGVALFALTAAAIYASDAAGDNPAAGATVRLDLAQGHCSGVHIGKGKIVTAFHCLENNNRVTAIKTDAGQSLGAKPLWINKEYDLALIEIDASEPWKIRAAPVSCVVAPADTPITVAGTPLGLPFVRTTGRVIGHIPGKFGYWNGVLALDVTAAGGNSGGPVYGAAGEVVGILVGGYPGTGFSFAVPGATVCKLLAR